MTKKRKEKKTLSMINLSIIIETHNIKSEKDTTMLPITQRKGIFFIKRRHTSCLKCARSSYTWFNFLFKEKTYHLIVFKKIKRHKYFCVSVLNFLFEGQLNHFNILKKLIKKIVIHLISPSITKWVMEKD